MDSFGETYFGDDYFDEVIDTLGDNILGFAVLGLTFDFLLLFITLFELTDDILDLVRACSTRFKDFILDDIFDLDLSTCFIDFRLLLTFFDLPNSLMVCLRITASWSISSLVL